MATPLLVADIGGTNGRFALACQRPGCNEVELRHVANLPSEGASGLEQLLAQYLGQLGTERPAHACLAIAGPCDGRRGSLTNLGWQANADLLERAFGLDYVLLVNDFVALASMAPLLPDSSTVLLKPGDAVADAPVSVLGPGTGLGVALVLKHRGEQITVGTEGGHTGFAAVTDAEAELARYLRTRHPHVSTEMLLSGAGLSRIHAFLSGAAAEAAPRLSPEDVSAGALQGRDPHCLRAADLFLTLLAGVAGDIALLHGARGGVYIGGGVVPRLLPLLDRTAFAERFVAKGPMRAYLERIPVRLIAAEHTALFGAEVIFRRQAWSG